jgi:hypothetical protein
MHSRRQGARRHLGDAARSRRRRAQDLPEKPGKRTLEEDMQRCFEGGRTKGTPTLGQLNDSLTKQITPALDASPNQEPGEETHPGGNSAAPDELKVRAPHATVSVQPVERRVFDLAIPPAAEREGAGVDVSRQPNGSNHVKKEITLAGGHR